MLPIRHQRRRDVRAQRVVHGRQRHPSRIALARRAHDAPPTGLERDDARSRVLVVVPCSADLAASLVRDRIETGGAELGECGEPR